MFIKVIGAIIVCGFLMATSPFELAQTKRGSTKGSAGKTTSDDVSNARANLLKATSDYKESLQKLAAIYQNNLKEETERVEKLKQLYAQGILSKKELDTAEQKLAESQASLDNSRKQMAQADDLLAESTAVTDDK